MVARNGHRVKVSYLVLHKILLHIAHHPQGKFGGENTGILRLVFFQNIGLHRTAHLSQRICLYAGVDVRWKYAGRR